MRRWLVVVEVVFALALLAAGVAQNRLGHGVEVGLIALSVLLAPAHLRRLAAILDRAPPAHPLLALVEAGALVAALAQYSEVPAWVVALGLAVALGHAWGTEDGAPSPSPLLGGLAIFALLAAGGGLATDVTRDPEGPIFRALAFAVVLLEALSPWRQRSDRDSLRRIAAAAALLGTSAPLVRIWAGPATPRAIAGVVVGLGAFHLLASSRPGGADRAATRRRVAMRLAAPATVLVSLMAVAEVAVRVVPNRYRDLLPPAPTSFHAPGRKFVYEGAVLGPRQPFTNTFVWNEGGWHDADHERAKRPGTARVVVLGDSYVEGVQVPFESLYHHRLERALAARSDRAVEAIGLGTGGWGQIQELRCLEETGLAYDPDLVIVELLVGNDIRNNDERLETLATEEAVRSTRARELFISCLRARLVACAAFFDQLDRVQRRLEGRKDPIDLDVYREPRAWPELWRAAWARTEELLEAMKHAADSRGVALAVVVFTSNLEIDACRPGWSPPDDVAGLDFRRPARRVQEICARRGIPCLDLAPRFAARGEGGSFHLVGDGHWNALGHEVAGLETAKFLLDETDLWRKALEHAAR